MLPRTFEAIQDRGRVNVLILGDSIACGSETSRAERAFVPTWAARFETEHGVPVTVANRALPGMTIRDGYRDACRWFRHRFPADLVVVAFGVNDQTPAKRFGRQRVSVDSFGGHAVTIGDHVAPADVVYVTPLIPAASWAGNTGTIVEYAAMLRLVAADRLFTSRFGTAVADVTAVWPGDMLLANGCNHPNDDGHRLYADVLADAVAGHPASSAPTSGAAPRNRVIPSMSSGG